MIRAGEHGLLETVILSILTIAICYWLSPQDPLLVHSAFAWIWFLPVLIALLHGRIAALISIAAIFIMMIYTIHSLLFSWDAYKLWLLGGITLTYICSEFNAYWLKRQYSLNKKEQYLDTRLKSLSRAYGILRLSHDRLEESLIIKPVTLREIFIRLRQLLIKYKGQFTEEIATEYLEILVSTAAITKAGLYLIHKKHPDHEPIASIGPKETLIPNDILIEKCLSKKATAYIAVNSLNDEQESAYLAVLPMQVSDGKLFGILTISEISFLELNQEKLKTLSIILAYIADDIWASQQGIKVQKKYPTCPSMFASEALKLQRLANISTVDSTIIAFYLYPSTQRQDIIFLLIEEKRALDIIWELKHNDVIILINLMPLSEKGMLLGYINRMETIIQTQLGLTVGEMPIKLQYRHLSAYKTIYPLLDELIHYADS